MKGARQILEEGAARIQAAAVKAQEMAQGIHLGIADEEDDEDMDD